MKKITLIAVALVVISACNPKKDNGNNNGGCTKPGTPTVSSNSPLTAGSTLQLSTPYVSGATYTWSGPGFYSALQNPVIKSVVPGMSGAYSVKINVGNCMSDPATTNVNISPVSQPCSMNANTIHYTGTLVKGGDLIATPYCISSTNKFEMTASDSNGTFGIIVYFAKQPTKDDIYGITDMSNPGPNQVYITAQSASNKQSYNATGGLAFVKVIGSSISISFCSIPFTSPGFANDNLTVTANITCQ